MALRDDRRALRRCRPLELLTAARERGTALSVVLNRVPPDAVEEVSGHLRQMLAERGLGDAELLVIREVVLEDGLIPAAELMPVQRRLDSLSADAAARSELVRRTLSGALDSLPARAEIVESATREQRAAAADLRARVENAYKAGVDEVDEAVRSGSLLRGEVLARWHDVVGTGDLMRALETRVSWMRERLREFITGKPAADAELKAAVETSVDAVVLAASDRAAERAASEWRQLAAGRALLDADPGLDAVSPELLERTKTEVRSWQGYVFDLVRTEGASKRTTARLSSLGVNGAGLTVMLAVFVSTGGLTGTEFVIAGGTAALSQKVLEAIFGDQAVRALAARARTDLMERVQRLLDAEAARFLEPLDAAAPSTDDPDRIPRALHEVEGGPVSELDRRLEALAEAVELADGRLDAERVQAARAVVERAGKRLGLGVDETVIALAGPTGAGKSTVFNSLAGEDVVASAGGGRRRAWPPPLSGAGRTRAARLARGAAAAHSRQRRPRRPRPARPARLRLHRDRPPPRGRAADRARRPSRLDRRSAEVRRLSVARPLPARSCGVRGVDVRRAEPVRRPVKERRRGVSR